MMLRELEEYTQAQQRVMGKQNDATTQMKNYMDDHFEMLKKEVGIDVNYGFEEDSPKLEDVMAQIKANTDPRNFRDFWHKKDNINKSLKNRAISRKLN